MRRSFVRLIISSVLVCWAVGFVITVTYSQSLSWTEDKARRDGVFLVHEMLQSEPASGRAERLRAIQEHFGVPFELVSRQEVERRVGRSVNLSKPIPHKECPQEEWLFLGFQGEERALAAGPVNPKKPPGLVPVGLILLVIGLPIIAALVAVRVERELTKVERASEALAVGDLSARVDNQHGPSAELAASFNAMAERMERLIRSRDELVQAISHELGSPLSRLRFHMELLDNIDPQQREERLSAMTRDLDALDALVAELLGYVQSDELKLDRETFEPKRSMRDLAELARLEAPEEREIEVELKLDHDAQVFADQRLFQRAVENILRNAMQHARTKVQVELIPAEDEVRVVVHDDGPGIPKALREKVMVPFFRLEADRDRRTGGVGLGLAIVGRIMSRHGGQIAIGSSALGGATIELIWPALAQASGSAGSQSS